MIKCEGINWGEHLYISSILPYGKIMLELSSDRCYLYRTVKYEVNYEAITRTTIRAN